MPNELNVMSLMANLDAVDANGISIGRIARVTAIEVMHRERSVRRDFIQALTAADRLLNLIVVVEDLVSAANHRLNAARQAQAAEFVIKDLIIL